MHKKLKMLFSIVLCMILMVLSASATDAAENVVYVSAQGDDLAVGTADAPVGTLEQAYTLLGANGGTIILLMTFPSLRTAILVLSNRRT